MQELFDEPNPYFFPKYTKAHKEQFKEKLVAIFESIEGTEVDASKKDEIKDLVYEYEMHKRSQSLQEVFDIVKEHFTTGDEYSQDRSLLMCAVYETLMDKVMQPKPLIEETMFFPSKESQNRLAKILTKAKKTLEICVFAFTNDVLCQAIRNRHQAGVEVRIITDDECSKFFGADIWNLVIEGVQCTMDSNKRFHMHNKFAIIDDLVLATGSFNWTSQAVTGNQENLCVIDNEKFVKDYKEEFEKLWEKFKENKVTPELAKEVLSQQDDEKKRRTAKGLETRKRNKAAKDKAKKDVSEGEDE